MLHLFSPTVVKTPTREALEALYAAAHGSQWHDRSNWLSGRVGVCKWRGIDCERGEVTSIDLGGNGVTGTLPPALAGLRALRVLNIDESRLSGTLPAGLAALTELETILLATNPGLSGTLPAPGRLAKLGELDVSRSRISGTLSSGALGGLRALKRLQLDHTSVAGSLPTQLGALPTLESLFVHESPKLSGVLPTQLGGLASLHYASFAGTRLSGVLPTQLGALAELRQLWLVHMRLSGTLPAAAGGLRALTQLELHGNRLSGALPSQLARLSLRTCVLTAAQGPHQARHSMRPADHAADDTNAFDCPLPRLPAPCVPHLQCSEPAGAAARQKRRGRKQKGRGGRGVGRRRGRLLRRARHQP